MTTTDIQLHKKNSLLKGKSVLKQCMLMALLTLAGIGVTLEADAQTRDITKDTTEIRIFFKNPAIFSSEEMKEFDMLWTNNLKSDIGDFILDYIQINFDLKSSDYEVTVMTCILLDPDRKTSLGKRAYEEIMKNPQFQRSYNLMLQGIENKIALIVEEEKLKSEEEKLKLTKEQLELEKKQLESLEEFGRKLDEMKKVFEEFGQ